MQNINDQSTVEAKTRKYMPMVEFCVRVAIYQLEKRRYFTIKSPATSKMWYTKCLKQLLRHYVVGYGTLDICAYGLLDPSEYYYYKLNSFVHNSGEALQPVLTRFSNGHQHQPIELAQIYPYKFFFNFGEDNPSDWKRVLFGTSIKWYFPWPTWQFLRRRVEIDWKKMCVPCVRIVNILFTPTSPETTLAGQQPQRQTRDEHNQLTS